MLFRLLDIWLFYTLTMLRRINLINILIYFEFYIISYKPIKWDTCILKFYISSGIYAQSHRGDTCLKIGQA